MAILTRFFSFADSCRLIASRYPSVGILDRVASPEDLQAIFELEAWTNDRISAELGILNLIPADQWVTGRPGATVIMAAFCHPRPDGGRFNDSTRGAWYAADTVEGAHAEIVYHRTKEFEEIGVLDSRAQYRLYLADFAAEFIELSASEPAHQPYLDPNSYVESQELANRLLNQGSNGLVYPSVRKPGATCIACFMPPLIKHVRQSHHFEYQWHGTRTPTIRRID
jgi:RES domain-containing protein